MRTLFLIAAVALPFAAGADPIRQGDMAWRCAPPSTTLVKEGKPGAGVHKLGAEPPAR